MNWVSLKEFEMALKAMRKVCPDWSEGPRSDTMTVSMVHLRAIVDTFRTMGRAHGDLHESPLLLLPLCAFADERLMDRPDALEFGESSLCASLLGEMRAGEAFYQQLQILIAGQEQELLYYWITLQAGYQGQFLDKPHQVQMWRTRAREGVRRILESNLRRSMEPCV